MSKSRKGRERERERGRERERQTDRETDRERERERKAVREEGLVWWIQLMVRPLIFLGTY